MANTRPWAGSSPPPCFIRPGTFFYPVAAPSSHLTVKGSYIYTVLKLHSALWRQLRGWRGPWKWVWQPWHKGNFSGVLLNTSHTWGVPRVHTHTTDKLFTGQIDWRVWTIPCAQYSAPTKAYWNAHAHKWVCCRKNLSNWISKTKKKNAQTLLL